MSISNLPPEILSLLRRGTTNIKRYKRNSISQIIYRCFASPTEPDLKQYYFPFKGRLKSSEEAKYVICNEHDRNLLFGD